MGLCWSAGRLLLPGVKVANPVSVLRWWLAAALAVLLAGCEGGGQPSAAAETAPAPDAADTRYALKIGEKTASLQLAVNLREMQRGLMGRTDLGADDGMVFIYGEPQRMSFWMRNTPTPLDIGFFDARGVLKEVYQLYPYDETPVQSAGSELKYAVEMRQGWYRDNGVRTGARLDLAGLAAAVRRRGQNPNDMAITAP